MIPWTPAYGKSSTRHRSPRSSCSCRSATNATNIVVAPSSDTAEAGDLVWLDVDGDGVKDVSETGIANVEVTLKDQYGAPLATTVTDGSGNYLFTGVSSGADYYVEVTDGLPQGFVRTGPGRTDHRSNPFGIAPAGNYRDEFESVSYINSDSSLSWFGNPWMENDAGEGGASGGERSASPEGARFQRRHRRSLQLHRAFVRNPAGRRNHHPHLRLPDFRGGVRRRNHPGNKTVRRRTGRPSGSRSAARRERRISISRRTSPPTPPFVSRSAPDTAVRTIISMWTIYKSPIRAFRNS